MRPTYDPLPIADDNEDEVYKVEKIVGERIRKGKAEFLVKWQGYPDDEMTWEPEEHLDGAKDALLEWRAQGQRHKSAETSPEPVVEARGSLSMRIGGIILHLIKIGVPVPEDLVLLLRVIIDKERGHKLEPGCTESYVLVLVDQTGRAGWVCSVNDPIGPQMVRERSHQGIFVVRIQRVCLHKR
jgi:hypothetical protein